MSDKDIHISQSDHMDITTRGSLPDLLHMVSMAEQERQRHENAATVFPAGSAERTYHNVMVQVSAMLIRNWQSAVDSIVRESNGE